MRSRRQFITLVRNSIVVIAWAFIALASSSANAQQSPRSGCIQVTKTEYDGANSKYYANRFGTYAKNGALWRRQYWYCPGSAAPDHSAMW
jgi:hypothetical protein